MWLAWWPTDSSPRIASPGLTLCLHLTASPVLRSATLGDPIDQLDHGARPKSDGPANTAEEYLSRRRVQRPAQTHTRDRPCCRCPDVGWPQ